MREHGLAADEILVDLAARQGREPSVHGARLFGLVYPSGRPDLEVLLEEVNRRYLFGNALNPFKFVELAAIEREVIDGVGALLHIPEGGGGAMTSGGTESILMSMLVNRERARARGVERPQILAPVSAHPAYAKAAHYFGMEMVRVPLDADFRADVRAARTLIGPSTAVVIASAFNYPYGMMDPVEQLAAPRSRARRRLPRRRVHRRVRAAVPRTPRARRAAVGLPRRGRHRDLRRRAQVRVLPEGRVGRPAPRRRLVRASGVPLRRLAVGSVRVAGHGRARRPAAPIATAWAAITYLGVDGYTEIMRGLMETTAKVRDGIEAIDGLEIVGDPIGPVLSFRSDDDRSRRGRRRDGRPELEPQPQHRSPRPAPHAVARARVRRRRAPRRPARRGRPPRRVSWRRGQRAPLMVPRTRLSAPEPSRARAP